MVWLGAIVEKDGFHHDFRELLCAEIQDTRGPALTPHTTNDSLPCRAHRACSAEVLRIALIELSLSTTSAGE